MSQSIKDANESIQQQPLGGYCYFTLYPKRPVEVTLDGDFDLDDIRRVLQLMETIQEDLLK